MSIDAVIERVRVTDAGLRLELAPRYQPEINQDSIAGQPALLVIGERHFEPEVGMVIWGGANSCLIVDDDGRDHPYQRLGYTRLQEVPLDD